MVQPLDEQDEGGKGDPEAHERDVHGERHRLQLASPEEVLLVGGAQGPLQPHPAVLPRPRAGGAAASQFWAPPMPSRASVTFGGFSMIWLKRTTVTTSSIETGRP